MNISVAGANGSIGRLVVARAAAEGHAVYAVVRRATRGLFPEGVQQIVADITRPGALDETLAVCDAVIFTHGARGDRHAMEAVDYGAVKHVLTGLRGCRVRVALMTAIGVTHHEGAYNRSTGGSDWKRRSERLLRASGLPCTIVRPGWFDYNTPDQQRLLLQGDRRHSGTPRDGVIARLAIARVLLESLSLPEAVGKTFELVAEAGPEPFRLAPLLAYLEVDRADALDGAEDADGLPLADEPASVRADLEAMTAMARSPR